MSTEKSQNDPALLAALSKSREQLEHLRGQLTQIQNPPATLGIFFSAYLVERQAEVYVLGRRMRIAVSPQVDLASLQCGDRVRVTQDFILAGRATSTRLGVVVMVVETLGADRVIVESGAGAEKILLLAQTLRGVELSHGDELRADLQAGIAFEKLSRAKVEQMLTPQIPQLSYAQIGGLSSQIETLREAVEIPFTHPDLFHRYGIKPPRGVLLYGPPGCGKTLLAKAVAAALHRAVNTSGTPHFLSIKGPELLSKFVGETERQIRLIFRRARQLAKQDSPVIIFFDEMEALFKTRGSGISSDVETSVVPQFLAELDGIDPIENVIVIGASNREDMIDPAILRSGRLDIRIKVSRPTRSEAESIAQIYLPEDTPLSADTTAADLIQVILSAIYDSRAPIFTLELADGTFKPVFPKQLVSGAAIAGMIVRAKKISIKQSLDTGREGISPRHMRLAVEAELAEMADLAISDSPQAWARTLGMTAGEVKRLHTGSVEE